MRKTITISLSSDVRKRLDQTARRDGVSRSGLVSASLRHYFFIREFRAVRQKMVRQATARGIMADDDVFERAS